MKKSRKETISTERTFQAARKFSTDFHQRWNFYILPLFSASECFSCTHSAFCFRLQEPFSFHSVFEGKEPCAGV